MLVCVCGARETMIDGGDAGGVVPPPPPPLPPQEQKNTTPQTASQSLFTGAIPPPTGNSHHKGGTPATERNSSRKRGGAGRTRPANQQIGTAPQRTYRSASPHRVRIPSCGLSASNRDGMKKLGSMAADSLFTRNPNGPAF